MSRIPCVGIAAVLALSLTHVAAAQPDQTQQPWTRGTTLAGSLGIASASSTIGPLAGGAFGWEITPLLELEGSAAWLDRRGESEAFHAALTAHVDLTRPRAIVPFVKGGVGFYRASFGATMAGMPEFYRRRLAGQSMPFVAPPTFTDTSFIVGAGAHFFKTRHVEVGPVLDFLIVRHDSRSYVVTTFAIRLAYHFEEHLIPPD